MSTAWVYILKCADNSYYTGSTTDINYRIAQHKAGEGSTWTKTRLPVQVVFCEEMPDIVQAQSAEHKIKKWSRAKKEALIAGDWEKVRYFAKKPRFRESVP